jgi:polysaccharide pyruvyl transferase WcaK-like protein
MSSNSNNQPGESRKRVGILGHVGTQNLGDEAIIASVIQNVRARYPDAEINCFAANPEDTESRHHIRAFPIRRQERNGKASSTWQDSPSEGLRAVDEIKARIKELPLVYRLAMSIKLGANAVWQALREAAFLMRSYGNLKGTDILLIAGSQQLNDAYGGPWGFPYTLFKWTILAKLAGTKVAVLSVGAGPLDSPLSRFFCRRVLSWADYRSYRDDVARQLVQSMGVTGEHPVVPDLVYSLRVQVARSTRGLRPVVGINPVPFFDGRYWPVDDRQIYDDYVRKIAAFAEWLVEKGHQVVFFPTQLRADPPVIDDILPLLQGRVNSGIVQVSPALQSVEDLLSQLSKMDFVVANRYHGILLSIALNKPVLGLAYHDKSKALLMHIGASEFALDTKDLDLNQLKERFTMLESRAEPVRKAIAESMGVLRAALSLQYDQVFALLGKDWIPSGPGQAGRPINSFHARPAQQNVGGEVSASLR